VSCRTEEKCRSPGEAAIIRGGSAAGISTVAGDVARRWLRFTMHALVNTATSQSARLISNMLSITCQRDITISTAGSISLERPFLRVITETPMNVSNDSASDIPDTVTPAGSVIILK
jgi:hypothetical protein